jgi:hypothetical protein
MFKPTVRVLPEIARQFVIFSVSYFATIISFSLRVLFLATFVRRDGSCKFFCEGDGLFGEMIGTLAHPQASSPRNCDRIDGKLSVVSFVSLRASRAFIVA